MPFSGSAMISVMEAKFIRRPYYSDKIFSIVFFGHRVQVSLQPFCGYRIQEIDANLL